MGGPYWEPMLHKADWKGVCDAVVGLAWFMLYRCDKLYRMAGIYL